MVGKADLSYSFCKWKADLESLFLQSKKLSDFHNAVKDIENTWLLRYKSLKMSFEKIVKCRPTEARRSAMPTCNFLSADAFIS